MKTLFETYLEAVQKGGSVLITCDTMTSGDRTKETKTWTIEYENYFGNLTFRRTGSEVDEFEIDWDEDEEVPEDHEEIVDLVNDNAHVITKMKRNDTLTLRKKND